MLRIVDVASGLDELSAVVGRAEELTREAFEVGYE